MAAEMVPRSDSGAVKAEARREYVKGLKRFLRNPSAVIGFLILSSALVLTVIGPMVAPYGPSEASPAAMLQPPSAQHVMGTDELGRDILSRLIYGLPLSMLTHLGATAIAVMAGTLLGLVAGFFRGWVDNAVIWISDVLFAFPAVLLAIAVMAILGSGLTNIMIAVGIVYAPRFARLTRATVLSARELDYVQAARAIGSRPGRIMFRHILPNLTSPLVIQATLSLSTTALNEAALSFLGMGAQPPAPSWGNMLNGGRAMMELAPWTVIWPSLAIVILLLGYNLAGDGLRDLLDPRDHR